MQGNQPLLLDNPQNIWVVVSGFISVFATKINQKQPEGNRRYLFSVRPGEALFGISLSSNLGILAVALENTELRQFSLQELAAQVAKNQPNAIMLLEGWLQHLGEALPATSLNNQATVATALELSYFSLEKNQILKPSPTQIAWVQVRNGNICWLGVKDLSLDKSSPLFPLAKGMWLQAENSTELYNITTKEWDNPEQLTASLAILHRYFCCYLELVVQQEKEAQFRRFQAREKLNRQLAESALGKLASVLQPQEARFFQEGTPLLIAAGAVARVNKITIKPPAPDFEQQPLKDPLEAITQTSQFRTRRVALSDDWWRREQGPLLAYMREDNSPVALLPNPDKGSKYILFDPVNRSRTPINKAVAKTICPEAYVFYRPLPPLVNNVLELFLFGINGYQKDIILIVLIGMIATFLGMFTPQATGMLVDKAIPDSDHLLLWQMGLALLAAAFGQSAFQLSQGIITLRVENVADGKLQLAVWDRLLKLTPAFFRQYTSGDLVNRLLAINEIRSQLSGATQRTLLSAIFSLLNLGLMFVYNVKLALVGLGITLLTAIVTFSSGVLLVRKERQQEQLDGEISGLSVQLINGVAKLRVAAAEERAFAAWAQKYSQRMRLEAGIQRINDSLSTFNEALPLISSVLLFWFAVLFMQIAQAKGNPTGLSAGTFLAFNAAFGTFISGVTDLSNTLTDIIGIVPLWERVKSILQAKQELEPNQTDSGRLSGHVVLDHVIFRYREDGPLILDDVSLNAKPGEFVAIVGPSGSGKSTLFRLLLGFETPSSGTVYYDGQDLAGLDVTSVRRQLGVVLQNGRVQQSSIFDNITGGALVGLDQAWEAARMAGLAEDIEQMPMGMHTVISGGGSNLSGGQRQRLLIARALVNKPKIILMDEATSALDNRTQAIVTESLEKLNTTRIVIAHRLSTIRNADRIYVMESGRLVQVGSFEKLVKQEGLFARLAARQLE
ncbi:MAG: NHLP bacteriocin export ABC transporter permease/ATPase subunit [Symploca sp. SIO1C4]|uniref:NHLP bacteriocin export ABC transporter permease/ATPase subunit n=1 Tax=Symploca sp. SIO1C4 TaxID=2607765 RepID=A0A6B3NE82_9CYAN|nr:NHLP bacteriocin export ABC transporter permease/ATPase subunit [Symploca sp. SIO1C4]NET04082.1 NHLP bacteriocin export ABC transporter permease/ATPase subunit [Symploca sp. SIO2B6]